MGEAKGQATKAWCRSHGLPVSASFSMKKYSDVGALEWCQRLQFFYDAEKAAGGEAHHFKTAEVEGYAEDEDFTSFVAALPAGSPCVLRAHELRAICPRPGGSSRAASSAD